VGLETQFARPFATPEEEKMKHYSRYSLGTPIAGSVPGMYTACWGYKPEETTDITVALGNVDMSGVYSTSLALTTYKRVLVTFDAVGTVDANEMWAVVRNESTLRECELGDPVKFDLDTVGDDFLRYSVLLPTAGEMTLCYRYDDEALTVESGTLLSRGCAGDQTFSLDLRRTTDLEISGIFGEYDQLGIADSVFSGKGGQVCRNITDIYGMEFEGNGKTWSVGRGANRQRLLYWNEGIARGVMMDFAGEFNLCWRPVENNTAECSVDETGKLPGKCFGAWVPGVRLEVSGAFVGQAWAISTAITEQITVYGHDFDERHTLSVATDCADKEIEPFPIAYVKEEGEVGVFNVTVFVPGVYRACLSSDTRKVVYDNDAGMVVVRGPLLEQQNSSRVYVPFDLPVKGFDLEASISITLSPYGCESSKGTLTLSGADETSTSRRLNMRPGPRRVQDKDDDDDEPLTQEVAEAEYEDWGVLPAEVNYLNPIRSVVYKSRIAETSASTRCAGRT
jgi:hypothetical protein